ncbi:MAG: ABC transporter substrate-binding protein [Chloroflexia bacterium]|nr:ABC transporter substrate-binding protein [Chloroflexia bacterium]
MVELAGTNGSGVLSRRKLVKGAAAGAIAAPALLHYGRIGGAQTPAPTGTVRLSGPTASPEEEELLRQVLDNFAQAYPSITVNYEPVPAEYLIKLQTDIAAGNAADVFYVKNEFSQDFMSRNTLLPIDEFMANDGVADADFYPGLINAFKWQGATYGLPKDWSPLGTCFDEQVFTDAGISAAPATWDELRTVLQTLLDTTGQPSLVIAPALDRFIMFLYQAGGNITNEGATEITLGDPATLEALDFFYGLYSDGLSTTPADSGAEWPGDALAKQLASIVFEGNWMFPFLNTNAPDLQVGVAELPAGPGGKGAPAFTNSYSIFAGSQQPEAAWVLVNYLTGNDGMALWTSLGLAMPARPGLMDAWLQQYPDRAPYAAAGEYTIAVQYGPGGQKFNDDANAVLQNLFAGQIDTAAAQQQLVEAATADITLATPSA